MGEQRPLCASPALGKLAAISATTSSPRHGAGRALSEADCWIWPLQQEPVILDAGSPQMSKRDHEGTCKSSVWIGAPESRCASEQPKKCSSPCRKQRHPPRSSQPETVWKGPPPAELHHFLHAIWRQRTWRPEGNFWAVHAVP